MPTATTTPAAATPTAVALPPPLHTGTAPAVTVEVDSLVVRAGRRTVLDGVNLTAPAGQVLAVAGASGAGKSTLLEAIAGLRPVSRGTVRFVVEGEPTGRGATVGFVPQDDIIHLELPLRESLRFAARLRLPGAPTEMEIDRAVDETLARLELTSSADVRVGSLSGGQRKRASIATELLARPDVLLLDEPTSGLDPATAREVMRTLRGLADRGTTVVLTTHGLADLEQADRIAFVAPGGQLAFCGTPDDARRHTGSDDLAELYRPSVARRALGPAPLRAVEPADGSARRVVPRATPRATTAARQWRVLTRRTLALLSANRLTLAIMFGSPALVIAMMVVLFPAGAAADPAAHPTTAVQTMFWIAFAGFFFGLTAGLLQVVPEAAISRRERFAGVRPAIYVASKVTALAPVLVCVTVGMLGVLHGLDRLPTTSSSSPLVLTGLVLLETASALALGLLASALVKDAAQATLALPMLCFPQVLFAGAVVAVADMATVGSSMSFAMATRWGFEGIARSLGAGAAMPVDGELAPFEPALTGSALAPALVLAAITVALLAATVVVVRRRTR